MQTATRSLSFRLVRAVAIISFAFWLLVLLATPLVTIIPRRVDVFDEKGLLIGHASLPGRDDMDILIYFTFMALSGFQIWMLSLIPTLNEPRA